MLSLRDKVFTTEGGQNNPAWKNIHLTVMGVKNDSYYMLDYGQVFDPLLGVKITPVFFQ